jgi:hypothetical protein
MYNKNDVAPGRKVFIFLANQQVLNSGLFGLEGTISEVNELENYFTLIESSAKWCLLTGVSFSSSEMIVISVYD